MIGYLDCFSGISGDMLLGALIDNGVDPDELRGQLDGLKLDPWDLEVRRAQTHAIGATTVRVTSKSGQTLRTLANITEALHRSRLDELVVTRSLAVFQRLAQAEAKIHDRSVEQIHFHEVGALDTIVDIVGSILGLQMLNIEALYCSPLPLGRGFVRCAHGHLPLPAPAVCEILKDVPVVGIDCETELVTPTGAALAAELSKGFGPVPPMRLVSTGYGAGDQPGTSDRPNLLRLIVGHQDRAEEAQLIEVIETHLDDWSPEGFPHLCSRLFHHQALDVSLTPILMKKGRPGFCLRVLAVPAQAHRIKEIILSETSAIGLRYRSEQRLTLPRRPVMVATCWGEIAAKQVSTPAGEKIYPEYEACRSVAEEHGVPLDRVYREVLRRAEESR